MMGPFACPAALRCLVTVGVSLALQGCTSSPAGPSGTAGPRIVRFSSYDWEVKTPGDDLAVGPGPNVFSDSDANVSVDSSGALHLRILRNGTVWRCAEVILTRSLGYGRY